MINRSRLSPRCAILHMVYVNGCVCLYFFFGTPFKPTKQPCPPSITANHAISRIKEMHATIGLMLFSAAVDCEVKIHDRTRVIEKTSKALE